MNPIRHRAPWASLCVCLLLAVSACSDDPGGGGGPANPDADVSADAGPDVDEMDAEVDADAEPGADADAGPQTDADAGPQTDADADTDGGTATGLRLEGQLVPTGGLSMSSSFTLSGHLSPGTPDQKSSSANFQLELTPAPARTDN